MDEMKEAFEQAGRYFQRGLNSIHRYLEAELSQIKCLPIEPSPTPAPWIIWPTKSLRGRFSEIIEGDCTINALEQAVKCWLEGMIEVKQKILTRTPLREHEINTISWLIQQLEQESKTA